MAERVFEVRLNPPADFDVTRDRLMRVLDGAFYMIPTDRIVVTDTTNAVDVLAVVKRLATARAEIKAIGRNCDVNVTPNQRTAFYAIVDELCSLVDDSPTKPAVDVLELIREFFSTEGYEVSPEDWVNDGISQKTIDRNERRKERHAEIRAALRALVPDTAKNDEGGG